MCDPHADELFAEISRHEKALEELRRVNYATKGGKSDPPKKGSRS